MSINEQMADETGLDPLQYLNRVERLLVGWSVSRQFETNVPRFAKWVQKSGPHAAARIACAQAFQLYAIAFSLPGVIFNAFEITEVSYPLLILTGVCLMCDVACIITSLRPQQEYRRAHKIHTG